MKEAVIQKAILEWLNTERWTHWRSYTGPIVRGGGKSKIHFSKNPAKGFPDICLISRVRPGRLITFEVKTPVGKLSAEQKDWMVKLENSGVAAYVVRSLDEFIAALTAAESQW